MATVLTVRQKQIGLCLLSGMSLKEIARRYEVSVHTVRDHQNIIKAKLSCRNAYQMGYLLGFFLQKNKKLP